MQQQEGGTQKLPFDEDGNEYKKLYKHLGTQNRNKDLRRDVKAQLEEKEENKLGPGMWMTLNPVSM